MKQERLCVLSNRVIILLGWNLPEYHLPVKANLIRSQRRTIKGVCTGTGEKTAEGAGKKTLSAYRSAALEADHMLVFFVISVKNDNCFRKYIRSLLNYLGDKST